MKGFLIGGCIISAVIATVYSLYCIECFVLNDRCVSVAMCKEDEVCLTAYEIVVYYYTNVPLEAVYSGCWRKQECNLNISITTPHVKVRYATSCCDTDNCTAPLPTLMTINGEKNGLTCPACYTLNQNNCSPQYSMACTGEERTCIHLMTSNSKIHSRGCSTTDQCNLTDIIKRYNHEQYTCNTTNTTSSLPVRNFLFCQACHGKIKGCKMHEELCSVQEDVCMTENIRTISYGQDVQDIIKRCGKSEECGRVGTLRSNEKKVVINTTCCDTNSCDSPIPTLPPFESEANGLTCPSCYISNSDICLQRQPLKCVGNETRCINYISKDTIDKTVTTESFYGCTTENICKAGSSNKHYFFLKTSLIKTTKMDVTCNKAFSLNSPVHPPLVSLIIGLEVISAIFIKEYLHLE